jgi:Domain of unknown function (DUF4386)
VESKIGNFKASGYNIAFLYKRTNMAQSKEQKNLVITARIAGAWYLVLAIAGLIGFMLLHKQIYVDNDPSKTLANLNEHETLARIRLLLELTIVVSQALAAVWFFKLFKNINHVAAWALATWGTVNACVIMISAIAMGGALGVVKSTLPVTDQIIAIQLLQEFMENSWSVGGLFFGLWLIPMGFIILSSQCMPIWLGRVLILGGIGYILNTFINYLGVSGALVNLMVIPATIGEFWIIGYLLIFGIRPSDNESSK